MYQTTMRLILVAAIAIVAVVAVTSLLQRPQIAPGEIAATKSAAGSTSLPFHPVVINRPTGPPRIATDRVDALGRPVTLSCASCHAKGGRMAKAKSLDHFDMTSYPFGGHHAGEITATIRKSLAIGGGKATMPKNKPGSLTADELAAVAAWADAFDASHEGGAHEGMPGHDGHDGHHDHGGHKH